MIVLSLFEGRDLAWARSVCATEPTLSEMVLSAPLHPGWYCYRYRPPHSTTTPGGESDVPLALLDCSTDRRLSSELSAELSAARIGEAIGTARALGSERVQLCALYRTATSSAICHDTTAPPSVAREDFPIVVGAVTDLARGRSYYTDLFDILPDCQVATGEIAGPSKPSDQQPQQPQQPHEHDAATSAPARSVALQRVHLEGGSRIYRLTPVSAQWWRIGMALTAPHQVLALVLHCNEASDRERIVFRNALAVAFRRLLVMPHSRPSVSNEKLAARRATEWSLSRTQRRIMGTLLYGYTARHGHFPADLLRTSHNWEIFQSQMRTTEHSQ